MTESAGQLRQLQLQGLGLARGGRRLVAGVDVVLAAGEIIALTGANGVGKTTLLRTIAGLAPPAEGQIRFLSAQGEMEAETARAEQLHLLAHADGLKTTRTAREELDFWGRWFGGRGDMAEAVATFSLAPLLDLDIRKLSAGQRRRVALARLIAAPRPLWLLDEPMAPLDAATRSGLCQVMRAHLDGGGMIIAAVHDPLPLPTRTLHLEAAGPAHRRERGGA